MIAPMLALLGCASAPQPIVATAPAPAYKSVRLVGKVPQHEHYRFVGRVAGVAPNEDFVTAVHDARVDIKTKAAKLGARIVKIDKVRIPSDKRRSSKPMVLLSGRAYGVAAATAVAHHRRVRSRHPSTMPTGTSTRPRSTPLVSG